MASSESDKLDEITNALNEVNDILVEFNKQYNEIEKMDAIIINKLSNYKSIINNSSLPDIEKIQYIISIKKLIITFVITIEEITDKVRTYCDKLCAIAPHGSEIQKYAYDIHGQMSDLNAFYAPHIMNSLAEIDKDIQKYKHADIGLFDDPLLYTSVSASIILRY